MELYFPIVLDGATGTRLQERGYTGGGSAEKWILEHPEDIIEIQRGYVMAGSRVIYSPTFGANRVKLEANGIFNSVREYNVRLALLSRQATMGHALVAGDLAPTGLMLAPMGETCFQELVDIYTEQASALAEAEVDLFVIETMMTMAEARAALLAVKSVSDKPVLVSFTCDETGRTLTGTDVTAALVVMQGMGADAFGLNCSVGPRELLPQIQRLQEYAEIPLLAKPNAGIPKLIDGRLVYDCPPEEFAGYAQALSEAGVALFGGCCGTGEAHIECLRDELSDAGITVPAPEHEGLLPCCTEREPRYLPSDTVPPEPILCGADFEERLEEALEEDGELISVAIADQEGLEYFSDCQYSISKPLCLCCDDAQLLEAALRAYQGRAMYEGPLPAGVLDPLSKRYGLIY